MLKDVPEDAEECPQVVIELPEEGNSAQVLPATSTFAAWFETDAES